MEIYTGQKSRKEELTEPRFDLDKIGQQEANDQEGPGFYFTTSKDEAKGYAYPNGIIVTVNYKGNNLISEDSKVNKNHVNKMIEAAPDLDDTLSNWGYDPGYMPKESAMNELKTAIYSEKNAKDIFITVWFELYRYESRKYVENMIKLGYDGLILTPKYSEDDRKHVVLYNVNSIDVTDVERFKPEKSKEIKMEKIYEEFLDDIRGYIDKDNARNRINVKSVDKERGKARDAATKDTGSNYNDGKRGLEPEFVNKLLAYIDGIFPSLGSFGGKIKVELRKHVKSGEPHKLEKTNKRVRDTLYKEYFKFLDNVEKRLLKILIDPK